MQCKFVKENGETCNSNATKASSFCFVHNPRNKHAHKQAASKGGRANRVIASLPPVKVENFADGIKLVVDTINALREGSISSQRAKAIGYLANIVLKAWEAQRFLLIREHEENNNDKRCLPVVPELEKMTPEEVKRYVSLRLHLIENLLNYDKDKEEFRKRYEK